MTNPSCTIQASGAASLAHPNALPPHFPRPLLAFSSPPSGQQAEGPVPSDPMLSPWLLPPLAAGLTVGLDRVLAARERSRFPPPDRRVAVGGLQLHHARRGDWERDGPLVVLEADLGQWSTHWGRIPEALGLLGPTLTYDRRGLGWSDGDKTQSSLEDATRVLHRLLQEVAPSRKVVLVSMGYAAFIARLFASRYPHDLVGLVLVDPAHEDLNAVLEARALPIRRGPRISAVRGLSARFGLARWLPHSRLEVPGSSMTLTPHETRVERTLSRTPRVMDAQRAELRDLEGAGSVLAGHGGELTCPIRVLSIGTDPAAADALSGQLRIDQQGEFSRLGSNFRQDIVGGGPSASQETLQAALVRVTSEILGR